MSAIRVLALDSDEDDHSENYSTPNAQSDFNVDLVILERKIYLKAALKLLDQRDQILEERTPKSSGTGVIKYGTLKKASGGSVTRMWKEKYIELRHGHLSYGDYSGWGQTSNWKTIPLVATNIHCYQTSSNGVPNGFIFALKVLKGPKRLWMADSHEEMMSWISSIKTAMIGSAGDFSCNDVDYDHIGTGNNPAEIRTRDSPALTSVPPIQPLMESEYRYHDSRDYIDGLPAYLNAEIRKFLFLQSAITKSSNSASYRELLGLYFSEPPFTIPISFIKSRIGNSILPRHRLDKKKFVPTENSQAWKDLHRDIMIINGITISGGIEGPEVMLGTLVRVILDKIRQMRDRYAEQYPVDSMQRRSTLFTDLDESQVLSCARDVLLSCNRTESGGDTYLAIESLLINKSFAVLTPLASEEEPLEIIVDIVESERKLSDRAPLLVNQNKHQTNSKRADDSTDSSGISYSVSTNDNVLDDAVVSQFQAQFGDSNDLSVPSDIDGATAIKSTTSQSKLVKRRVKESSKFQYQSGSVSDSSNYSDSNHQESFIPDTSHEETSESADDAFLIRSMSFDSSDSPPMEKSSLTFPSELVDITENAQFSQRFDQDSFLDIPSAQSDEVTIDLSEVTLDSALMCREKQNFRARSLSKVIGIVSPNLPKLKSEKRLLSHFLPRNEGRFQIDEEAEKKHSIKKPNALSGIREALRSRLSSNREPEDSTFDLNPAAQSMCIRIQMIAKSRYRLCNLDPQNESEDNWAIIHGGFRQVFFLKSNSNGRPSMSDRLVTVKVVSPR